MKKIKASWTWENAAAGTEPEFGWISWIEVTLTDEDEDECVVIETYVGFSLPEDFTREDLTPYEQFGLDADAFYDDFAAEEDVRYKPSLLDDCYNLDAARYENYQLIEGFKDIFEQAYKKELSIEYIKALQELFFDACKEVIL